MTRRSARLLPVAAAALAALVRAATPAAADAPDPNAMTFTLWHSNDGVLFGDGSRDYIFADGDITADTPAALQQFLDKNPPKANTPTTVVLNSDGGDLGAGLQIGEIIRKYKLWTQVGELLPIDIGLSPTVPAKMIPYIRKPTSPPFPGYCYSACTFAFLGGVYRFIDYGSDYGVHRFEFANPQSETSVTAAAAISQEMSGQLVKYVAEMGVGAEFITEMSLKGSNDVTHLTMQQMADLNVITPRWKSTWRIGAAGGGFFLGGWTADSWGLHEIAITCAPPATGATTATAIAPSPTTTAPAKNSPAPAPAAPAPAAPPSPAPAKPPAAAAPPPKPPAPGLFIQVWLDPGVRGNAADLAKAVQQYVLELDEGSIALAAKAVVAPATAATTKGRTRITAKIRISQQFLAAVLQSNHIGFGFLFNPAAKLPMRLIAFESDLDAKELKRFAGTCH